MASLNTSTGSDALDGSDPIDLGGVDIQRLLDSGDLELVGQGGPVVVQQQEIVHSQIEKVVPSAPLEKPDNRLFDRMRSKVLAGAAAAGMLVGVGSSDTKKAEAGDTVVAAAATTTEAAKTPEKPNRYNPLNGKYNVNSPEVQMIKAKFATSIESDEALVLWLNTYGTRYDDETLDELQKRKDSVKRVREVESIKGTSGTFIMISVPEYYRDKSTGKIYKVSHYYLTTTDYRIKHNKEDVGGGVFQTLNLGHDLERANQVMDDVISSEVVPGSLAKKDQN